MFLLRCGSMLIVTLLIGMSLSAAGPDPADGEQIIEYHGSGEIASILEDIATAHPSLLEYNTARELLGTRVIPGGRVIPILITKDPLKNRPWVMLIGAHHGDEPDSAEAVLSFADHLMASYANGDERASWILDNVNLAILPVVNPYGLDMGTRVDENGEDPNRDYPFEPSGVTSTTDGIPLNTAGAHAVHSLAKLYPFSLAISFHSGSKGVFHTWGAPNVGMITPDAACFTEVGRELSKASGQDLLHGPANQFPYVADLSGAFDDHLYGSTFLPDHLHSPSMQLPWSTFTATVELDTLKGQNPGNLGSLAGLWDHPLTDQGTVPMGVRICYSACEMAFPDLEVDHQYLDGNLTLVLMVRGALTIDDAEVLIDGTPYHGALIWQEDPLLPEWTSSLKVEMKAEPGYHQVSLSIDVDGEWMDLEDDAYPLIGPQSILARSRENLDLHWSGTFLEDGGIVPEPEGNPSLEMDHDAVLIYDDDDNHLGIDIDLDGMIPISLDIVLSRRDETVSRRTGADRIMEGYHPYSVPAPPSAGIFEVEINLTYEDGYVVEKGVVEVLPSVRALSVEIMDTDGSWSGRMDVDGVDGSIPIYWGVTRSMESPWSNDDWVLGPYVAFPSVDGITDVQMDLADHGRTMYFHVTSTLGEMADEENSWSHFNPDGDVDIIGKDPVYSNGTLTVGPVLVVSRIDGLDVLGPEDLIFPPLSGVANSPDEKYGIDLEWIAIADMTPDQTGALQDLSFENGITWNMLTGAFFGNITFEPDRLYTVWINISGNYTDGNGMVFPFIDTWNINLEEYDLEEGEDEESRKWISWQLIVFLIAVALVILLVSYLRYDAHGSEPEPEEEEEELQRRGPQKRSSPELPRPRKIVGKK